MIEVTKAEQERQRADLAKREEQKETEKASSDSEVENENVVSRLEKAIDEAKDEKVKDLEKHFDKWDKWSDARKN